MRKALAICASAMCLGGCSLSSYITSSAVDYNATIEDVNNQQLVINVLRARDQAPLYFTELGQIHGVMSASAGNQFTIPFGPGKLPGREYTNASTLNVSSSPTFDTSPLDTQDFTAGLLKQVPPEVFGYFAKMYSQSPAILYLFIDNISFADDDPLVDACKITPSNRYNDYDPKTNRPVFNSAGTNPVQNVYDFHNNPDDPRDFRKFESLVSELVRCRVFVQQYDYFEYHAPPVTFDVDSGPRIIASATSKRGASKQAIHEAEDQEILADALNKIKIVGQALGTSGGGGASDAGGSGRSGSTGGASGSKGPSSQTSNGAAPKPSAELWYRPIGGTSDKPDHYEFAYVSRTSRVAICSYDAIDDLGPRKMASDIPDSTYACIHHVLDHHSYDPWYSEDPRYAGQNYSLRSVAAMFSYLGALQRYQEGPGVPRVTFPAPSDNSGPEGREKKNSQTLFYLQRDSTASPDMGNCATANRITVSYQGEKYFVRGCDYDDRTLDVLAQLALVLALNKSAADISTTRSVDVNAP